ATWTGSSQPASFKTAATSRACGTPLPALTRTPAKARSSASEASASAVVPRSVAATAGTVPRRRLRSGRGGHGSDGLQPELGDRDLAHPELLDLPAHGHRERVDELPEPRDLERGHPPPARRVEVVGRQARAVAELDPGHDLLAVALARDAD